MPSANNGNFDAPRFQFQEDTDSAELSIPQRRTSAELLSLSNPSSSSFFSSQQQLPSGTFTNSGPFSRPPSTAQQFISNGQQTQFQPIRNSGSLNFADAVSAVSQPSFFQQTPIQRPQQQQQFNFFPGNSQQQRFRPIVQQQRTEQQDSIEHFDGHQVSQPSLTLQPSSQERFSGDVSRRPVSQTNRIIPGARNPSPVGSVGWWNPSTADTEQATANNDDETDGTSTNDDELNQQSQHPKRGREQTQQGKRKPITTPVPSVTPTFEQRHKPAAIGFTVIHDENDDRSSWSQPIITTHRPQPGQISFRNRNSPTVAPASTINRRPTTYNPLSVVTTSTSVRSSLQPSDSSIPINRQQPTTVRSRKSSLLSTTTTTTASTLKDEEKLEEEEEEQLPLEEKRQFLPRKTTTTTQLTPVPITTLRSAIRPRLNTPAASIVQQQRMKKIVNNPAIIQSITTRKPVLTSTSTLPPKAVTNVSHQEIEEYDDYEEYTTLYTTTELPSNTKQTKFTSVTQPSTAATNQKNDSLIASTESWFVVASVQTSRSVSSSINKNLTVNEVTTSIATTPTTKHRFNNKPTTTTTSTTTVESIIDKLDRVQSELSNGILYGSSSTTNNSRILTDLQNTGNNDKRNDAIISSFATPTTEKMTENTIRTTTSTTTSTSTTTMATSSTTEKEEDEDEDKEEKGEEESDDSDKETTFVRKFVPSKQRTTITTTTSTVKPPTQVGKKKSLIDSVKFDELLTSGLLPSGFNPKAPPAYKSKIITTTTTTTTEASLPVINSTSVSKPNTDSSSITINTTPSTVKPKLPGLNIKFADDPSALASLLPPGFKLEDTIKPVESLLPSLLPPGYKPSTENTNIANNSHESISTTVIPTTEEPLSSTTTLVSTTGIVFPNSAKGSPGTRKPLPSSKKIQASVTVAPVIQKGWPVR